MATREIEFASQKALSNFREIFFVGDETITLHFYYNYKIFKNNQFHENVILLIHFRSTLARKHTNSIRHSFASVDIKSVRDIQEYQ